MSNNFYSNFVRPSPQETIKAAPRITGEEAKRLYLEEIKEACDDKLNRNSRNDRVQRAKAINNVENISDKDLFLCVQNDDVEMLRHMLDAFPDKLNTADEFGWTLLMIACQAESIDIVKELLKRGADMSVRDKGGNSARSLVIKNRNIVLADILLSYSASEPEEMPKKSKVKFKKIKSNTQESFFCDICNKVFPDKTEHLSSTVHNISASKDRKIPTNYVIPQSNKGYQIMLSIGWDKESGLGPHGTGNKYPIKTMQKQDKKGLGLDKRKRKTEDVKETVENVNRKVLNKRCSNNRSLEIQFRREFY